MNKSLIDDYIKKYPELLYLLPNITHNAQTVTDQLKIIQQVCWTYATLDKKMDNLALTDFNIRNLIKKSTKLMEPFVAAAGWNGSKYVGTIEAMKNPTLQLLSNMASNIFNKHISEESLLLLIQTIVPSLDKTVNALTDANYEKMLPSEIVTKIKAELGTSTFDKYKDGPGSTSGDGSEFKQLVTELLLDKYDTLKICFYLFILPDLQSKIKVFVTDGTTGTDPSKVDGSTQIAKIDELVGLLTFSKSEHTFKSAEIQLNEFLRMKILEDKLYTSNNVMFASATDSVKGGVMLNYAAAFPSKPVPRLTYDMLQDNVGNYVLKVTDERGNITEENIMNIIIPESDNMCAFFGANNKNPAEVPICTQLVIECLGDSKNTTACVNTFLNKITTPSTKLKAFDTLPKARQQFISYKILTGFGFNGKRNTNGDLDFKSYTSNDIKTELEKHGGTSQSVHIKYIQKLMDTVGVIVAPSSTTGTRPKFQHSEQTSYPTISLNNSGFSPLIFQTGAGNTNLITSIQYGGSEKDAKKIQRKIEHLIATLKKINPRALPIASENKIKVKLEEFKDISKEIEIAENLINSYITVTAQYPNKDIVFTEAEIKELNNIANKKKQKMSSKLNKLNQLVGLFNNKISVHVPHP